MPLADPYGLGPGTEPSPRLTPAKLRVIADLAERLGRGAPGLSVRDVLLGLSGLAVVAGRTDASPTALHEGVWALDATLPEGLPELVSDTALQDRTRAEYEEAGELICSPSESAVMMAAQDMLREFARRGLPAGEPDPALPPPRTLDVLARLSPEVVDWLRDEARRRAGPIPGPTPEPHTVREDGVLISTVRWPTDAEVVARRAHFAAANDLGAVIEDAVRAAMGRDAE